MFVSAKGPFVHSRHNSTLASAAPCRIDSRVSTKHHILPWAILIAYIHASQIQVFRDKVLKQAMHGSIFTTQFRLNSCVIAVIRFVDLLTQVLQSLFTKSELARCACMVHCQQKCDSKAHCNVVVAIIWQSAITVDLHLLCDRP